MPVLLGSAVFFGMSSGGVFGIGQTLAGPRAAGQWIGVQNFVGNLAGIVALPLTGMLVDHFGGYGWAFGVAGGVTTSRPRLSRPGSLDGGAAARVERLRVPVDFWELDFRAVDFRAGAFFLAGARRFPRVRVAGIPKP